VLWVGVWGVCGGVCVGLFVCGGVCVGFVLCVRFGNMYTVLRLGFFLP